MDDIIAAGRSGLLHALRGAFPGRSIRLAAEEFVISSTGSGHYSLSLPALEDPHPEFRLFFVNVNDMPGDGVLLGVFTSAADAVSAAISYESPPGTLSAAEFPEAREAVVLSTLGFPDDDFRPYHDGYEIPDEYLAEPSDHVSGYVPQVPDRDR